MGRRAHADAGIPCHGLRRAHPAPGLAGAGVGVGSVGRVVIGSISHLSPAAPPPAQAFNPIPYRVLLPHLWSD
jgi:hypothetical protein